MNIPRSTMHPPSLSCWSSFDVASLLLELLNLLLRCILEKSFASGIIGKIALSCYVLC